MLEKIYVHNFRCFQNFELVLTDVSSALLLGKNGVGKSSLIAAIEVLQQIGRGVTQVKELIHEADFGFGSKDSGIAMEITARLHGRAFVYSLEIEFPETSVQPKVRREELAVDGKTVMQREGGDTVLNNAAHFTLDWHHVGLPIISVRSEEEPIAVFRRWLRNIIVLSPCPSRFAEVATLETADLERHGETILDWAHGILSDDPSLYSHVSGFLKERMTDFEVFKFETVGREKELWFTFSGEDRTQLRLNFSQLSDGEKIFFLAGILLSALHGDLPLVCLWDEPDHYISLPELSHFMTSCRRAFENDRNHSQLIITSHNERVLNEFSDHNTFILSRARHTYPTRVAVLADKEFVSPRVVDAYENGELD